MHQGKDTRTVYLEAASLAIMALCRVVCWCDIRMD